ncbi:MAG: hypothetical protein PHE33_12250, partial [Bacteroidales bacterium]|nr:hypothetical protein [Bacteroidales bacterium]
MKRKSYILNIFLIDVHNLILRQASFLFTLIWVFATITLSSTNSFAQKNNQQSLQLQDSKNINNQQISELDKFLNGKYYKSLDSDSVYQPVMTAVSQNDERISHLLDEKGSPIDPIKAKKSSNKNKDGGSENLYQNIVPERIDFVEIDEKVYYRLFVDKQNIVKYYPSELIDFKNYPGFILLEIKTDINKIATNFLREGADSVRIINDNNIRIYKSLENLNENDPRENYHKLKSDYTGYYT